MQPQFDIVSALWELSETRLAANEIQEQHKIKNRTIGNVTFVHKLLDKDVKPKLEVKKEEVGYGKKGPTHHNYDYSKARYIHPDGSVCRAEQRKQAEKESQLPDLPTTITDTNINPNDEGDILQNLPMETTTIHMESSLTVETTSKSGTTNVQENNPALNVETVTGNTLDLPKVATNVALNVETDKETQKDDLPPGANVALNVETDKETQKDGLSHGLNVETSLTDNSQQPVESDVRGLNVEMEANMVEKTDGEIQTTETGATQEWQEDIEHLTDVTTEVNRTNAAIGLLLLNSPRSTHMDTEDEELVENELLMPVGGEKQPDLVMEIEQQNKNKTSTNTMDPTTLNNTPEGQDDVDSDGTIILET